jgi:glycosyltransferase involved in cell wall biosynthesis
MRITVVTVCRNAAGVISDCVHSVAAQDHPDVEHLVVDGASRDGTVDVVRSIGSDRLRWVSEPDEGLYFALNKGLRMASGDVVGCLHADDVFADPGVLSRVAQELRDGGADACYGDLEYVSAGDSSKVVRFWRSAPYVEGAFGAGWMPPHPTFYARAGVYHRFGGFDTRFSIGADWDLLFRLFEIKRIRAGYLPGVMVRMRLGGISNRSLKNIVANNLQCLRVFRKYGKRVPPGYLLAKLRHRLAQFT